ncbi:hypothetical protein EVA_10213 [gut metagenome]|uniref:Uncharacterized protein n=1 Tax=gut metagenome TaxID=749906 RepID=J9CNJ4_9ZZZZ
MLHLKRVRRFPPDIQAFHLPVLLLIKHQKAIRIQAV